MRPCVAEICSGLLGESLNMLGLMQIWHRRAVAPEHKDVGIGAKHTKQPVCGLITLSNCLCLCWAVGEGKRSCEHIFSSEKEFHLSQMHSKKWNGLSQYVLANPQNSAICPPELSACLFSRSTAAPSGLYTSHAMHL